MQTPIGVDRKEGEVRDFIQIGRLETGLPLVDVTGKVGGYRLVWRGVLAVTFAWA